MFVSKPKGVLERNLFNQLDLKFKRIYEKLIISFRLKEFYSLIPKDENKIPKSKLSLVNNKIIEETVSLPVKETSEKKDKIKINFDNVTCDRTKSLILLFEKKLDEYLKYFNNDQIWTFEKDTRYNTKIFKLKKGNGNIVRKSEAVTEICVHKLFETIDDISIISKWQKSVGRVPYSPLKISRCSTDRKTTSKDFYPCYESKNAFSVPDANDALLLIRVHAESFPQNLPNDPGRRQRPSTFLSFPRNQGRYEVHCMGH
jgi:hypothetical protein